MTVKNSILVVDDEEDVRRYLGAILEDAGFEVRTARDGDDALEQVKERAPDLISLDLVMPGRSGTKFLYAMRKNRDWQRIPVLIVTGHAHDEEGSGDLQDILAGKMISGPETYLEKPVSPISYVRAIERQLGVEEGEGADLAPPPAPNGEIETLLANADLETKRQILKMLKKRSAE